MDDDSIRLWIIEKCLASDNPSETFHKIQSVIDDMETEMTQSKYLLYPSLFNYWEDVINE